MSHPTLRERQRQAREDAILEAAHDLLMEQGFAAMSMDDLAARVGASKATIYQHFPSKEELAIKVIARTMRVGTETIGQQDQGLPAIVQLERWLRAGLLRRASFAAARIDLLPHSIKQHPDYQQHLASLRQAQSALVERAKAEGDIAPGLSTPVIIHMIQNLFRLDYEDLLAHNAGTPAELIDSVLAVMFDGIRITSKEQRKPHL